jgi:putative ABC transport system permease protein
VAVQSITIDIIAASLAERRFSLILLGAFGLSALILSIVGVYGVLSYFVSQRTREIGLRVALGAKPEDIFYAVIGDGGRLAAIGVTTGLIASFTLTRFISSLLFNVSPTDLVSFAIPAAVLGVAILLACYVPARRALRIDPIAALRDE